MINILIGCLFMNLGIVLGQIISKRFDFLSYYAYNAGYFLGIIWCYLGVK